MQTLPQYLDFSGLMRGPETVLPYLPKKDRSLFLNMNKITKEAATQKDSVLLSPTDNSTAKAKAISRAESKAAAQRSQRGRERERERAKTTSKFLGTGGWSPSR